MILTFLLLPLAAGGLTWFATWPLGKWVSLVIGLEVSAGAFAVAPLALGSTLTLILWLAVDASA